MRNNSLCSRYNFDIFSNTLTVSKEFEQKAAIPGTIEQITLCQYMATYGDDLIIARYNRHNSPKGLNFKQMKVFISKCRDSKKRLDEFETVKHLSAGQSSPYKYVKTWFLENYANYSETPKFDADGFAIVKTKAEVEAERKAKEAAKKAAEAPAIEETTAVSSSEEATTMNNAA